MPIAPSRAAASSASVKNYDIVVYGGTASAITAAIQADKSGMRVALVSPDKHLGGMVSSGLGWTDSKDEKAIGGLAREFHHRIWKHYRQPDAWIRGNRASYAEHVHAQPGKTIDDKQEVMWTFEPHIAEKVFEEWLAETDVEVHRDEWLDRDHGVGTADQRIHTIRMLSGATYVANVFIDGTYEGDLMAAAGVTYRVGRDSAQEFNEPINGIYFTAPDETYSTSRIYVGVSPYRIPNDPASGFLVGVEGEMSPDERKGDGDTRLQSFNYRLCLTTAPENRVPIKRPANYDEANYELLLRLYENGHPSAFSAQEMPNRKTDSNNSGPVSLDYVGGNFSIAEGWNYSEAGYEQRRQIVRAHVDYVQGVLWTAMNHPRIAEKDRRNWSRYGLAKDEFTDNGHWPHQLYVREARRMCGVSVMTQHHVDRRAGYEVADSIGLGSYSLDSHKVRRVVIDGQIHAEGGFYFFRDGAYPISYGSIVPKRDEVQNLLVPVTLSATHVAFGSIRMEPTYMILGQSAGTAAVLATKAQCAVQDVPYAQLSAQLLADAQVLAPASRG